MSRTNVGRVLPSRQFGIVVTIGFLLLLSQSGSGQQPNGLNFFKNYFVTGDYTVAGVGLRGTGVNGIASGNIHFTGATAVPPNADILAAQPGVDSVPRRMVATAYDERGAALSPDSRWLAYVSN